MSPQGDSGLPQETVAGRGRLRFRLALIYGGMVAAAVVAFLLIDTTGAELVAPDRAAQPERTPRAGGDAGTLAHVLLALTAVLITGRLLGIVFRYVGQPPVIGEVVGGILLGPSFLGWLWPGAAEVILPGSVAPFLAVIAQLGVILYMFLVGLELNASILRRHAHSAVAISHASIVAPFLLGALLALYLYPRLSSSDVAFTSFALFLGVAMAITAFPVLARILTDRGLHKTPLGIIALSCAAVDDVTAWCLLAFVVGVAQAQLGGALLVLCLTVAFIAFMFLIVRPLARRFFGELDEPRITPGLGALVLAAVLLSSLTTEMIGIHAIFGAFLLGAVMPHDSVLARVLSGKFLDLVTILLLPAFFALTGMRTEIGLLATWEHWLLCGLIILVATAGKVGGTLASARLTGLGWRDSASLSALMNTRGLMELIVLNIGLEMGILSPTLFAMMVLMALVTTLATAPALELIGTARSTSPPESPG
jgi:Kef-type K+ transport system membrane component KefB